MHIYYILKLCPWAQGTATLLTSESPALPSRQLLMFIPSNLPNLPILRCACSTSLTSPLTQPPLTVPSTCTIIEKTSLTSA